MVLGATLALLNPRPAAQSQAESVLTRGHHGAPFVRVPNTPTRLFRTGPPAESGACAHGVLGRSDDVSPDAVGQRRRRGRTAGAGPARSHASRARAPSRATPRDQGLLGAVERAVRRGRRRARRQQYAEAMGQLHARDPDDPDVASLYALALLGTMCAQPDRHRRRARRPQPGAGRERRRRRASTEILDRVLRVASRSILGALHYLCTTTTIRRTRSWRWTRRAR